MEIENDWNRNYHSPNTPQNFYEIERKSMHFNYIVIGTGPAGCAIAKILSHNYNNSVLVLEAGENHNDDELIKESYHEADLYHYYPQYFWQGRTAYHPTINKAFSWTTGRLLGGGTSVNGEQYVRPTVAVLEEWVKIAGPVWSVSNTLNNLKEIETFHGISSNPKARGYNGRVNVRQAPEIVPVMTKKLVDAMALGTGYPIILDYNDPDTPNGVFYRWQLTQKPDQTRENAATAFLSEDIMTPEGFGVNGRNLRLLYKSTALRILFNSNKDAIGVEFLKEGKQFRAFATDDVIISAGINSTQLLMLSGIGDYEELTAAGIPVLINNPYVGKHLINHGINTATFRVNSNDVEEIENDLNALYTGGAFLPNPLPNADKERRSIQLIGDYNNGRLNVQILYLLSRSTGTIQIQNDDPLKIVLADEGYLTDPYDLEVFKDVYRKYIKNIADQLSAIDPSYQLINPSYQVINDDLLLENYIRSNMINSYHQQGSLRMASFEEGGVVDQYGRVYGVNHLIVADNSIVPNVVDGNTASPAYLIGYTIGKNIILHQKSNFKQR